MLHHAVMSDVDFEHAAELAGVLDGHRRAVVSLDGGAGPVTSEARRPVETAIESIEHGVRLARQRSALDQAASEVAHLGHRDEPLPAVRIERLPARSWYPSRYACRAASTSAGAAVVQLPSRGRRRGRPPRHAGRRGGRRRSRAPPSHSGRRGSATARSRPGRRRARVVRRRPCQAGEERRPRDRRSRATRAAICSPAAAVMPQPILVAAHGAARHRPARAPRDAGGRGGAAPHRGRSLRRRGARTAPAPATRPGTAGAAQRRDAPARARGRDGRRLVRRRAGRTARRVSARTMLRRRFVLAITRSGSPGARSSRNVTRRSGM